MLDELNNNTFLSLLRLTVEGLHATSLLLPKGRLTKCIKWLYVPELLGIGDTEIVMISLEAFLESAPQLALQIYVFFHGFSLGMYSFHSMMAFFHINLRSEYKYSVFMVITI